MTYFLPRVVGPEPGAGTAARGPQPERRRRRSRRAWSREVVAPDELIDAARAKAEKLAAKAPHYVRMSKLLCGVSIENSLTEHLQLERHGIADSMATEDLRNGVEAFFGGEQARVPRPLNRAAANPYPGYSQTKPSQSSTGRFRHEEGRSRICPDPRSIALVACGSSSDDSSSTSPMPPSQSEPARPKGRGPPGSAALDIEATSSGLEATPATPPPPRPAR